MLPLKTGAIPKIWEWLLSVFNSLAIRLEKQSFDCPIELGICIFMRTSFLMTLYCFTNRWVRTQPFSSCSRAK